MMRLWSQLRVNVVTLTSHTLCKTAHEPLALYYLYEKPQSLNKHSKLYQRALSKKQVENYEWQHRPDDAVRLADVRLDVNCQHTARHQQRLSIRDLISDI